MEFIKKCGAFIKKNYQKQWFMWVMLIFIAPVGIFLMFKYNKKYSKTAKIIISILSILFMVCGLTAEDTTQVTNTQIPQEEIQEEIKEDTNKQQQEDKDSFFSTDENQVETNSITTDFGIEVTNQLRELGFTVDEATSIYNIFVKIGINQISNVQKASGTGIDILQCFVAIANNDENKKFYFTIEKRALYYAGFLNDTLFDSTKGGVLKSIDDVHIPNTEVDLETYSNLQVLSQNLIKQYLKYPNTASFPLYDSWGVGRKDDRYQVNGKVTAKNGFGVKSDMHFSIWFIQKDNNFTVEAIVIDDVRVK